MIITHKIALDPTAAQRRQLAGTAGYCRLAYNDMLAWCFEGLDEGDFRFTRARLNKWWTDHKKQYAWREEYLQAPSFRVSDDVVDAWRAYRNPGQKNRRPCFKSRRATASFRLDRTDVRFEGRAMLAPAKLSAPSGCGKVAIRMREALRVEGDVREVTIVRRAHRWYVCVVVEDGADIPEPFEPEGAIGVDVGVHRLATTAELGADGEVLDTRAYDNPRSLPRALARLRRCDRSIARSVRGSNRRRRKVARRARLHARVADVRADAHHKASRAIVCQALEGRRAIAVETLNVGGMVKNRRLSRAISDAAMSSLLAMIAYKCIEVGVPLHRVGRWTPTTKTCSGCGAVRDMTLSERRYDCAACGMSLDRDENAARNIAMAARHAVSGRGGGISREPPGARTPGEASTMSGDSTSAAPAARALQR